MHANTSINRNSYDKNDVCCCFLLYKLQCNLLSNAVHADSSKQKIQNFTLALGYGQ